METVVCCNFAEFFRRPVTILRLLSSIFALIVFSCILLGGYVNANDPQDTSVCIFNENVDACHYGVWVGFLALLGALVFLALDIYFPTLSNINTRKYIVLSDLGFTAIWTFLWFVGFCFLANQWAKTNPDLKNLEGGDGAPGAIAFSFFSILSWFLLVILAYKRYKMGVDDFNTNYMDPNLAPTSPFSSYPDSTVSDHYQRPTFTQTTETDDGYNPPAY